MEIDRGGKDGWIEQKFLWWMGSSTEERFAGTNWTDSPLHDHGKMLFHILSLSFSLLLPVQRFPICYFISQCLQGGWCTRLRLVARWHTWEVALALWVNVHFYGCVCVSACRCLWLMWVAEPKNRSGDLETVFKDIAVADTSAAPDQKGFPNVINCCEDFILIFWNHTYSLYKMFGLPGKMLFSSYSSHYSFSFFVFYSFNLSVH